MKKFATETIPNLMKRLENMVGEKGFLVGDQVTKFYSYSPSLSTSRFAGRIPNVKMVKIPSLFLHQCTFTMHRPRVHSIRQR